MELRTFIGAAHVLVTAPGELQELSVGVGGGDGACEAEGGAVEERVSPGVLEDACAVGEVRISNEGAVETVCKKALIIFSGLILDH